MAPNSPNLQVMTIYFIIRDNSKKISLGKWNWKIVALLRLSYLIVSSSIVACLFAMQLLQRVKQLTYFGRSHEKPN